MLLTVEEALRAVRGEARVLDTTDVGLADACGAVLAEDVAADIDLPPFDKALVDGYAVGTSDPVPDGRRYRVVEEVPAGAVPHVPLGPGDSALVMTGAPLPPGADAVVMHERTTREGSSVVLEAEPNPGQNVLRRGREMKAGDVVLARGDEITAAAVGLLASVGRTRLRVVRRPRLVVVPTGDELVPADQVPGPGQIRNSNAPMLRALAAQAGAVVETLPVVPDETSALERSLRAALESDVVVVTGGVSAGNRDLVPSVLDRLGVRRVFHKVRLKPGKPLWFGVGSRPSGGPGPWVFGLPGNPVSGLVGFLLFVEPTLAEISGRVGAWGRVSEARLTGPFEHRGDRPTYHPARARRDQRGGIELEPLAWAGSADLRTVARADGFAVFPEGDRSYRPGEIVRYLPFR